MPEPRETFPPKNRTTKGKKPDKNAYKEIDLFHGLGMKAYSFWASDMTGTKIKERMPPDRRRTKN
jgi:hypothetical protein